MANQKQALGSWGEQCAAEYLEEHGYQIVARNVRGEYGEIDLLARHADVVVFVEVKARSSAQFGHPEEAITSLKQQHLLDSALSYLQAHPDLEGDWRIDVISVQRKKNGRPEILHFENALDG